MKPTNDAEAEDFHAPFPNARCRVKKKKKITQAKVIIIMKLHNRDFCEDWSAGHSASCHFITS